ncbi:MAG: 3-hydroxyacyl-CoA dehydrogenase NAD-binding domain-containing protein [Pseudomonadota bacterium]|nr:3-hydroxyacyl-CoA dehydrogenase NAD-binding domain-containing protein [Pseudomonadota bacterium]
MSPTRPADPAPKPRVVSLTRDGGVAVIAIDNPPVNALSRDVRAGLVEALDEAVADDSVRTIVVACAGNTFCAGADIREFDLPPQPPHLTDVIQRFEDAGKPVVAALHGNALGGGCELAAGCHYRVAARGTRIGLPEVNLGLLPGAGGTQRLPRLIGFDAALALMLDGKPRGIDAIEAAGFIDEIVDDDVRACAVSFARRLVTAGLGPRRTAALPPPEAAPEVFQRHEQAARKRRGEPAPEKIVAAIRRAIDMPFADAVARARADFLALRDSPESKALRHAFFAEREVGKPPAGMAIAEPRALGLAAVIGAGTMGQGIAIALLEAGLDVMLVETAEAALARAQERIAAHFHDSVRKGRMTMDQAEQGLRRLTAASAIDAAAGADVVIEAVFEDIGVKRDVFGKLDAIARPGVLLATNTSYLDVAEIAGFTRRPEDVIGLHFFSPANVMRLVEIVRTDVSSPDALATGIALVRRLKKVGVVCKGKDGFVGNRMLLPRTRECLFMLEEGALPEQIDAALTDFGFAMGPLAVGDLAGLDIGWRNAGLRRQLRELGRDCDLLDRMVAANRLGQKTGAGWYRYEERSRKPTPDPAIEAMLIEHARERGIERRTIAPAEIVERCLVGMINEGAKIIDEGVVSRASDVDVVWLTGYGFPRYRGGPLYYADRLEANHVLEKIRALRERFGAAYWTPAPALERMAAAGQGFYSG